MAARPSGGKATGWVIGAVLVALVMAAGAWSLAIAPVLDQASSAREEAESIRFSNDLLRTKISDLREQFEQIDEYKAELAAVEAQIPPVAELADYMREVNAVADANGVVVFSMTSDLGISLVPAVAAPPAPAEPPAEEEPTSADEAAAPSGESTPTAAPVLEGFIGIPITITAIGPYEQVLAFTSGLQNGTDRLFLVTHFSAKAMKEGDASGGRPATVVGDMELQISGLVYVLQSDYVLTTGDDTEDPDEPVEPTPLPPAVPGKNPLIPVGAPPEV
jgi:Tfp pilus assembly protein PilO